MQKSTWLAAGCLALLFTFVVFSGMSQNSANIKNYVSISQLFTTGVWGGCVRMGVLERSGGWSEEVGCWEGCRVEGFGREECGVQGMLGKGMVCYGGVSCGWYVRRGVMGMGV